MKIHDISVPVHDTMVVWPGLVPTRLTEHERIRSGDAVNVTNMSSCAHVGSHVDAPFHHYADGATIEQVPLDRYVGKAYVADLTSVEWAIKAADIASALDGTAAFDILILKTRNSTEIPTWERFDEEYVYIAPDGAAEIVRRGYKTVGFDHLAVEGYNAPGAPTHKILLGEADVSIIEGLDLSGIKPGYYWFSAAPVRLVGSDGSPTRAYLIEDETGLLLDAWDRARGRRGDT